MSTLFSKTTDTALFDLLQLYIGPFVDDAAATTAVGTPVLNQFYRNTTDDVLKVWDGSDWINPDENTTSTVTDAALVDIADVGNYFTSTDVEGALQELAAIGAPAIIQAPARPEHYSGTDTQKVQAAIDSGNPEVRIDDTFTVGTLTLSSTLRELSGFGLLQQASSGSRVLVGDSLTQDMVIAIDIKGNATSGHTAFTANDDAIALFDCDNVTIERAVISDFLFRPILVMGANRLRIRDMDFLNNSIGPRLIDAHNVRIQDNNLIGKCLTAATFTTGIGLESEGGISPFGRPVCTDVWIDGNLTEGFGASQGILVHGGKTVKTTRNIIRGSTAGISYNPYNTVDYITDPLIEGNTVVLDTTLAWQSHFGGNSAVICQAGPATGGGNTPRIKRPKIVNNLIMNGNNKLGGSNQGGIQCGFVDDALIDGNIIQDSKATGIGLYECVAANVSGNIIEQVTVALDTSGQRTGLWARYSTGGINANTFRGVGSTVDAPGMTWGSNASI